jgi:cephalosporin hydroxylase
MDEIGWAFYRHYGENGVWIYTHWLGVAVYKCPLDLWMYQEILVRTRPDVIVETGTAAGGSALYLASLFDLIGNGRVVTVDIEDKEDRPDHSRILYLNGSSVAPEVVDRVKAEVKDASRVMVILDSDHTKDHVLRELQTYGPMVSEDCYLIVEDMVTGEMIENFGPGPRDAVEEFLESTESFVVDPGCEKFLMTFNPGGYLKRVPPS